MERRHVDRDVIRFGRHVSTLVTSGPGSVSEMPPVIDVSAERAATPGCASVTHLNYAGAALPTAATLSTVTSYLEHEAQRGGYEAEGEAAETLARARASAGALIGADADSVVLTSSDTDGWTRAMWGLVLGGHLERGRRIVMDRATYDSHAMALLQVSDLTGTVLEVVASESDGTLDLAALAAALATGDVAMACLTHVGTHRGLVNPVELAGPMCAAAGAIVAVDACQSLGQLPVDVGQIRCDILTGTGRKWLRGPRGTGLLFAAPALAERMVPIGIDGRSAEWESADRYRLRPGMQRFIPFETPVALRLGLGTAIDHALHLGLEAISARVGAVAEDLRTQLASIDGVEVQDGGQRRCGIVTFTVSGSAPAEVVAAARVAGINVSATEAPAARLDMAPPRPTAVVRASPHYVTTDEELGRLATVVASVAGA